MKHILASLLILASSALFAAPHREGVILVSPKPGASQKNFHAAAASQSGKVGKKLKDLNVFEVSVPAGSEERVARALAKNKFIKFAEVDQAVAPSYTANDPTLGYHITKIGAPAAWDTSEGEGIIIAIADTGVQADHPDLVGKLVLPGYNFFHNNTDTTDTHGHGTAVAGAAAAHTNNGIGVMGVAGKARILPIRITDDTGYAFFSAMANAVIFAANNGARVVNTSYGGAGNSSTIQSAAAYMRSKGGVVVWSAGNDNIDNGWLDAPNILAVSATNSSDARASWSSFGSNVDLAAPGVSVWVTRLGSGYGTANGTSFSSPIVAGVAALVMAANPALTPSQVHSILETTAVDLGTAGKDIYFGHGRVNAQAAVAKALITDAVDTQPPTVAVSSPATGSTVADVIDVVVNATDNIEVTSVTLRVNNQAVATDTLAPYVFSLDTKAYPNGTINVVASATDLAGNAGTSATTNLTVRNIIAGDVTPPVITTSGVVDGQTISGTNTTLRVTIADASPTTTTIKVNGSTVATTTAKTYSYKLNAKKLKRGTHTVLIESVDLSLNKSTKALSVIVL